MFFIETTKYYLSFFSKNFITAPNTLPPSVRHILLQLSKGCDNTQYNRSILPNIYKVESKSPHNAEKKRGVAGNGQQLLRLCNYSAIGFYPTSVPTPRP